MDQTTVLLKINNTDFTDRLVQRSYSVQKVDEYARWIDGNWKQRRDIARTRVSGSFNLTFLSQDQFSAFLAAVAAVKTNGGYCEDIQLWVNNTKSLETLDAFLDFSAKTVWTGDGFGTSPEVTGITVKVTER